MCSFSVLGLTIDTGSSFSAVDLWTEDATFFICMLLYFKEANQRNCSFNPTISCRQDQNLNRKMRFLGLSRAKMTTIGIQNLKIIVTNDYQQFLANFEWFLALLQISDVKPELS